MRRYTLGCSLGSIRAEGGKSGTGGNSEGNMVYLKSLVAGIVAVVIAAALSPIVMGIYFFIVYRPGRNEAVGWDPTSFVKQPLIWAIGMLIFVAGFVWEFRLVHSK
jgi:hypothetical protein